MIFAVRRGILPKIVKCVVSVRSVCSRGTSSGIALSGVSGSCALMRMLMHCLMWPGVRMVPAPWVTANRFLMSCLGLRPGVRMVPAPRFLVI